MQHMCTDLTADACEWHISLFQLQAFHHQAVWVKGSIVRPMHDPACQQLETKIFVQASADVEARRQNIWSIMVTGSSKLVIL